MKESKDKYSNQIKRRSIYKATCAMEHALHNILGILKIVLLIILISMLVLILVDPQALNMIEVKVLDISSHITGVKAFLGILLVVSFCFVMSIDFKKMKRVDRHASKS